MNDEENKAVGRRLTPESKQKIAEATSRGVPLNEAMKLAQWETFEAVPVYGGDTHYSVFMDVLDTSFAALLRASGFKRSGHDFRHESGDVLQVVNVQVHKRRDQCCLNFGIHLRFLPTAQESPLGKNLYEQNCLFRSRLTAEDESDRWWVFGSTDQQAQANANDLIALYRERGAPFLNEWSTFPGKFVDTTVDELTAYAAEVTERRRIQRWTPTRTLSLPTPFIEPSYAALALARMHRHLKRREEARVRGPWIGACAR